MTTQPYDVIVFGATSFVGQILTRYLFEEFGLDGKLRWAAAGRSLPKLEELRKSLGKGAGKLTLLQADAGDETSLQKLCKSARVIVSTVGPYALYGEPLVRVCAETGTDYCDLTGEVQWMRRMIHKYEKTAQASGARIVHNCGFDSIPSDLGVHYLQQQAQERFGQHCTTVKMRVRSMRGSFSGGTVASLLNVLKEVKANPALRKELADPYSICPPGRGKRVRQKNVGFAEYDPDFSAWIAPFVMSAINTRVVHRTNALLHDAYGPEFRYDEAVLTGRGLRGRLTAATTVPVSAHSWSPARSAPCARCSRSTCCRRRARARVPKRNSRVASTCVSTAARHGAMSSARVSRVTVIRGTARPRRCSARRRPASRTTFQRRT